MNKNKMASFLKWLWIAAVLIFILFFIQKNYEKLKEALKQIDMFYLFLSFLSIVAAKILLSLFMQFAVRSVGKEMDYPTCFRIYNLSQLGKYIPGNIWHFVGKAVAYKKLGFSGGKIKNALVVENIWLVAGAFLYGLVLISLFDFVLIQKVFFSYRLYLLILIVIAPFLFWFGGRVLNVPFGEIFSNHRLNLNIFFVQVAIWTLLGLGFAFLSIPFIDFNAALFFSAMGLYAMAYSVGFVTPFAPAGIGVREGILAIGLLPYLSLEVIIILSAANRLLYVLVEIFLALISWKHLDN
jgi:hypothetical protein